MKANDLKKRKKKDGNMTRHTAKNNSNNANDFIIISQILL